MRDSSPETNTGPYLVYEKFEFGIFHCPCSLLGVSDGRAISDEYRTQTVRFRSYLLPVLLTLLNWSIETLPSMIGQLVYIGEGLTLGSSNPEGLAAFSRIVAAAEDIFVSIHDGCSKFQFIFCLHDKVFVEDHAEQIAKIKEKIRLHRMETMQLHRMLSGKD